MTHRTLAAVLSLILLAAACGGRQAAGDGDGEPAGPAAPGTPVGSLSLDRLHSGRLGLSSLRGRVVLLDVFATWCLPCIAAVPRLKALRARHGGLGLEVIGLSVDLEGSKVVEPFCEELGVDYPVMLADQQVIDGGSVLGPIRTLPLVFLVDRQGRVAEVLVGEVPHTELERAVLRVLGK